MISSSFRYAFVTIKLLHNFSFTAVALETKSGLTSDVSVDGGRRRKFLFLGVLLRNLIDLLLLEFFPSQFSFLCKHPTTRKKSRLMVFWSAKKFLSFCLFILKSFWIDFLLGTACFCSSCALQRKTMLQRDASHADGKMTLKRVFRLVASITRTRTNDNYVTHASCHYFSQLVNPAGLEHIRLITIKLVIIRKMSHFMIMYMLYCVYVAMHEWRVHNRFLLCLHHVPASSAWKFSFFSSARQPGKSCMAYGCSTFHHFHLTSVEHIWIWKGICDKRKMESCHHSMNLLSLLLLAIISRTFSLFFGEWKFFLSFEKISFLLNFPPFSFLYARQFSFHICWKSCWCLAFISPGDRWTIRLVKRRVEKHQQHSITHTSFTEKYVRLGNWGWRWWYMLETLEKLFPPKTCFISRWWSRKKKTFNDL